MQDLIPLLHSVREKPFFCRRRSDVRCMNTQQTLSSPVNYICVISCILKLIDEQNDVKKQYYERTISLRSKLINSDTGN